MGFRRLYPAGTGSAGSSRTEVAARASAPGSREAGAGRDFCRRLGLARPAPLGPSLYLLAAAVEAAHFVAASAAGLVRRGSWAWHSAGVKVTSEVVASRSGVACGVGVAQNAPRQESFVRRFRFWSPQCSIGNPCVAQKPHQSTRLESWDDSTEGSHRGWRACVIRIGGLKGFFQMSR